MRKRSNMVVTRYSVVMSLLFFTSSVVIINLIFDKNRRPRILWYLIPLFLSVIRIFFPIEIINFKKYHSWYLYPFFQQVLKSRIGDCIFAVWGIGVVITLILLVKQFIILNGIKNRAIPIANSDREVKTCTKLLQDMGYKGTATLAKTSECNVPSCVGYFHIHILLPKDTYSLTDDELKCILLHEINHFMEHDLWVRLFFQFLKCLLWWNPVVYFLYNNIVQLTELRCDKSVYCNLSDKEEVAYISAIYYALTKKRYDEELPAGFAGTTLNRYFKQRVALLREPYRGIEWKKISLVAILCLLIFLASYTVVIQPATLPNISEIEGENVREGKEERPFLLELSNGKYVYIDENGLQRDILSKEEIQNPPYNSLERFESSK